VTNRGIRQATRVFLTNTLPANWALLSLSSSQGACWSTNSLVVCDLGTIVATGSAVVTLRLNTTAAQVVTNLVAVGSAEGIAASSAATVSVEPSLPPVIDIWHTGQQALLSWPTSSIGFRLEATESLLPATWITATNQIEVLGESNVIYLDIQGDTRFYRLAKP
jgi:hypothetical protein